MPVRITGSYEDGLRVELQHGPSGTELRTAAPVDNQGDGSSFSPTDLLAAALGSCMMTTMAIVAEREGIPFSGAEFSLEKHMRSEPRRVGSVSVRIRMPEELTPEQRERLERMARSCPVDRSLHPDVRREVEFVYPDDGSPTV